MILSAILAMCFGILSAHCGARAGFGFAAEVRKLAFRKVQSFSFANLDNFSVPSLITRLTNDCNIIASYHDEPANGNKSTLYDDFCTYHGF